MNKKLYIFIVLCLFSNPINSEEEIVKAVKAVKVLEDVSKVGNPPNTSCPVGFSKTAPTSSTEVVKFPNDVSLKITMPDIECPKELVKGKICYSNDEGEGNIVLDPGHDLSSDSCRNGYHDEVHEGQGNMVMAMIARQLLLKCAKYNPKDKSGIKPSTIKMSYYPGAINYGDFTNGTLGTSLKNGKVSSKKIGSKGGSNLFNHINRITTNKGRTSVISVHQDAPDYASDENRKSEYPAVLLRRTRKNSADVAANIYSSVVDYTSKYYTAEQRKAFAVTKKDGTTTYPKLTINGYKNDSSFETTINGQKAIMEAKSAEVAQVMRVGNKKNDFTYRKYSSSGKGEEQKMDKLNSDPKKTEVALVETLFMDGFTVGARVQRELSDYLYDDKMKLLLDENKKPKKKATKDMPPEIKIEYSVGKKEDWKKAEFVKPIIVRRKPKKGESRSQIYYHHKDGPKRGGLRVSNVHIDAAKGIVAGIQKRFSCK